jgi:DNA polymerase III subunit epsilon
VVAWWKRSTGADPTRWVVLDVETSGLDAARDRLLAIAAIGVRVDWARKQLWVELGDSFEVVLRQDTPSTRENILLHGIGVQRQAQGVPAPDALRSFVAYAGEAPLLAFHAAFDRMMIGRHAVAALGRPLPNRWLDIEHLCAVTHPRQRARSLDEWLAAFGIRCAQRHQAIADTLAECDLLLRIWPRIAAEAGNWRDVEQLAARHRWVVRG